MTVLRRGGVGQVVVLFLVLLNLVPPRLVLPSLGGAGRPAALMGLAMLGWWLLDQFLPSPRPVFVAIKWAIFVYLLVLVASMLAGLDRGLPGVEARGMYRAFLVSLSLAGVVLVVTDGLRSREAVTRVLWWMVILGSVGASVGIVQFVVEYDLSADIAIPGLERNSEAAGFLTRGFGDFARVRGMAVHPIEFGVVLATMLPAAIHLAMSVGTSTRLRWLPAILIGSAIPLSISRSAMLALITGMGIAALGWSWRQRANAFVIGLGAVVVFQVAVPGLIGTLRSLFVNYETDNSVSGRTEDFDATETFINQRPLLGRGPGTFLPDRYRWLDNEYLGTLVETGWLGLASLVLVLLVAGLTSIHLVRQAQHADSAATARVLGAGVAIALVVFATFDAMFFPIYSGVLFLMIGCLGALYKIDARSRVGTADTDYEGNLVP